MPKHTISSYTVTTDPRRSFGAISATYAGTMTADAPTPIPTTNLPRETVAASSPTAMMNGPRRKKPLFHAMAFLLPGYEQASDPENPPIEPTVCVGRIVVEQELPDGRFNMVLAGLRRARVVAEDRSRPYRLAEVELIDDDRPGDLDEVLAGQRLYEFLTQLPARLVRQRERLVQATELLRDRVGEEVPLGAVLDLLADSLELLPEDRLSLLRERHVGRRLGVLTLGLGSLARQIQGQAPRVSWRPRFSDN